MKLILAIVHKEDSADVAKALTEKGFSSTKLATSGGFLRAGNSTIITGVEDDKVDEALEIISRQSKSRTEVLPMGAAIELGMYAELPMEVEIGGATVFVLDVARFAKL